MLSTHIHREEDIMRGTVRIMAGLVTFIVANGWFYNGIVTTQELIVLALGGIAIAVWGLKDAVASHF
jgi:hypothetical protein